MKVCLNYTLSDSYLKEADEIRIPYRSGRMINKLIEMYPKATYIIEITPDIKPTDIDWEMLDELNIITKERVILCLSDPTYMIAAAENNIKYFMGYFCTSMYEFNALLDLGVTYIRIGAPLFFMMDKLKPYKEKIRIVPNISYVGIKRKNGVHGQWIRPEDLSIYEDYIETIEFFDVEPSAEQALYRIFIKQKEWNDSCNYIWNDFNLEADNTLIGSEITEARLNCRQVCEESHACHICDRVLLLARKEFITPYLGKIKDKTNQ